MRNKIVFLSFFLLCMSCAVEEQLRYEGLNGNDDRCTVQVRMPDKWKIVSAQLTPKQLTIEFDRGRGREKREFPISFDLIDADKGIKYRGANKVGGLTLLYFTKEENPQSVFNPPIATSNISTGIKEREVFAIFRTSNCLMVHYSIENTDFGNLSFHDLIKRYYGDSDTKQRGSFKLVDGVLHFEFGANKNEKRKFPIQKFVEPHEKYDGRGGGSSFSANKLRWTSHFKMVSKEKKD
ncbi:MAG: hypothetical protein OXD54_12605 [Candidatus Poribacteria bacterium]|nr:hypothetical protein [Candidatus Poribacteria bacterium]